MTENKKQIFRKPLIVFLFTLIGLAILLTILALINEQSLLTVIGSYFLYGGTIIVIIGFVFIGKGGNSRSPGVTHLKNNEQFKKTRQEEKPFEKIMFSIITAAILIAIIGYFLNKYLAV